MAQNNLKSCDFRRLLYALAYFYCDCKPPGASLSFIIQVGCREQTDSKRAVELAQEVNENYFFNFFTTVNQ